MTNKHTESRVVVSVYATVDRGEAIWWNAICGGYGSIIASRAASVKAADDVAAAQPETCTGPSPGISPPAALNEAPASVEVEAVDGVLVGVVVVVGAAAWDRVDLEEPAEHGGVEADAHEGEAGEVVGLALLGPEPPIPGAGAGAGGAEFGGFERGE
jgi:hypothetical protein